MINSDINTYNIKRYWPHPTIMQTNYTYQNVNNDARLQNNVTNFFHKKLLKWLNTDNKFAKFKDNENILSSKKGKYLIHTLLHKVIIKSGINWYDLRDNYKLIKKFIYLKLKKKIFN